MNNDEEVNAEAGNAQAAMDAAQAAVDAAPVVEAHLEDAGFIQNALSSIKEFGLFLWEHRVPVAVSIALATVKRADIRWTTYRWNVIDRD